MKLLLRLIFIAFVPSVYALDGLVFESKEKYGMGAQFGAFLPLRIAGVTGNYPLWNLWFSHPMSIAPVEYSVEGFNAEGVNFQHLSMGFRIDFRAFDALEGYYKLGADISRYQRKRTEFTEFPHVTTAGGHIGFGVNVPFSDAVALRGDFKLSFNPGAVLHVGVGLARYWGDADQKSAAGAP